MSDKAIEVEVAVKVMLEVEVVILREEEVVVAVVAGEVGMRVELEGRLT